MRQGRERRPLRNAATCVYRAHTLRDFGGGFIVVLLQVYMTAMGLGVPSALATDPEQYCAPREQLVPLLTGKPHYEQQSLVLADEMPHQGHQFELFVNRGEGGRRSYTLIRTLRGTAVTCIVTAGTVGPSWIDRRRRTHLVLRDEGDPDIFDIVMREHLYIITRRHRQSWIRENRLATQGTGARVVSYGRVLHDRSSGGLP